MSKPFDYSKWDNIELSDDEDDVHPNIDKESWFRMKHRSRVEREENEEKDKKRIRAEVGVGVLFQSCRPLLLSHTHERTRIANQDGENKPKNQSVGT